MSKYQLCEKRKVVLLNGRKMSNQQIIKALRHKEKRPKPIFNINNYTFGDFNINQTRPFESFIELDIRQRIDDISLYRSDAIALAKHFKLTEQELRCEKK